MDSTCSRHGPVGWNLISLALIRFLERLLHQIGQYNSQ